MRDQTSFPREDTVERQLAAIFSADVKDDSRLISEDKAATFRSEM